MASEIMTAAEYSDSVRQWLVQAYQWQAMTYCKKKIIGEKTPTKYLMNLFSAFPSYLAFQASLQQQNTQTPTGSTSKIQALKIGTFRPDS